MDDRELLDEFVKARSQGAFRELVARHLPVVYSAARRMVRDSHLAEEVAQSVFTTLAQKAESIRPPQVLGGWLYNTTRHLAMHAVRTDQRRREREQTAYAMQALDQSADESEIAEHLEPAMAELDAEDRDALVLRFLANRGLREVGAELGVSEEAARKRVSRALERLRAVLESRGVTATSVLLATALTASTLAVPVGLGAAVATTALTGISIQTSTAIAATKAIAMAATPNALIAGIVAVALTAGVGVYVLQQMTAAPPVAVEGADSETGILKAPDGKPLPDAEVYLSTTSATVHIYEPVSRKVAVTRTGADGRFSFPLAPENRAVIVLHEKGYGQITVTELVKKHELTLQPWARVEGTLREGSKPLAGESIHLSRAIFGSQIERDTFRTLHDTKTTTDADGHYVFPRVAPGDAWISWRTYWTQTRYFDIQPGQSVIADIGGRGRPVAGRVVLADSDAQAKYSGSVWPVTSHQMRRPPNWSELSAEKQTAFTAVWEKSPDAKLYNQEKCNLDFKVAADGTFIVPDVPAGDYRLTVISRSNGPASWLPLNRGDISLTVPEMPGGRSDEPLYVGAIKTYPVAPLQAGEPAPQFETIAFDGKPLKLTDFKGKYVLLHFWRSDDARSFTDMAALKVAQNAWGKDPRFVLIGLNVDRTLAAAQRYATDNKLTWVQCYLGERSEVLIRYRLRDLASTLTWESGPKTVLIGPDGRIIRPTVSGAGIPTALEEVLGTRVKITQPGDLIFASSDNSRRSEGAANAIDNDKATKYLNHDSGRDGNQIGTFSPSGFAVQPAVGPTIVTGMGIRCANDAPDRDPDVVVLEGSNDPNLTSYESGTWTPITTISNIAAGFTVRWKSQEFLFPNATLYRNYRWRVEATRITPNRCCMQVAEVWLTGSAPSNQARFPAAAGLSR
jgi:RNA polymerase sigma factor (sigma-70 family)